MKPILYAYPQWHTVSFTLIARKHIEYLRKIGGTTVYEIDELMVPSFTPVIRYSLILHPAFYSMFRILETRKDIWGRFREDYYQWWRSFYDQLIGLDVCDSDAYTELAVSIANRFDKFVVPSRFCVDVARRSGIKARVYRLPHGVDPEWYTTPNVWESPIRQKISTSLVNLYLYKMRRNVKFILFFLIHSGERKGWNEVYEVYTRLARERRDVVLVLKTVFPNIPEYQQVMQYGALQVYEWLDDYEKMALFDMTDVTLMFSRGGGFEMVALESLARGVPVLACEYGSWTEYVPPFLWVKKGRRVQPLPNNAFHGGYGYAVDVEDALNKLHVVLDNLDEYRAKVQEWREKVLSKEYRWDIIAQRLVEIVND